MVTACFTIVILSPFLCPGADATQRAPPFLVASAINHGIGIRAKHHASRHRAVRGLFRMEQKQSLLLYCGWVSRFFCLAGVCGDQKPSKQNCWLIPRILSMENRTNSTCSSQPMGVTPHCSNQAQMTMHITGSAITPMRLSQCRCRCWCAGCSAS